MNVSAAANTTILDDLTPPALTVTGGDTNVGVYIVGEQIGSTATVDVRVRNSVRENTAPVQYTISFDVSDKCPESDQIESVTIRYRYKVRWRDSSVHEDSRITTGY